MNAAFGPQRDAEDPEPVRHQLKPAGRRQFPDRADSWMVTLLGRRPAGAQQRRPAYGAIASRAARRHGSSLSPRYRRHCSNWRDLASAQPLADEDGEVQGQGEALAELADIASGLRMSDISAVTAAHPRPDFKRQILAAVAGTA
jgi:hypothetical protein